MDDDVDNEDMRVEKNVGTDGEKVLPDGSTSSFARKARVLTDIPTAESLKLTPAPVTRLPSLTTKTLINRDDWRLEGPSKDDLEFFSTLSDETRELLVPPCSNPF